MSQREKLPGKQTDFEWMDLGVETGGDPAWLHATATALLESRGEDAIGRALGFLGEAAEADRTWMFHYNHEVTHFSNTYEWCRPGVKSFVEDLQRTPVTLISWLQCHLEQRRAVLVHAVGALPRAAGALKAEFLRQGNRSVLSVPLFKDGRLSACVGFDTVREPQRWSRKVVESLHWCGDLILRSGPPAAFETGPSSLSGRTELPELVYLHQGAHLRGVAIAQIAGITAEGDYTRIHLADGTTALELRPLKTWLSLLPRVRFQRIHRGALVNMERVASVETGPGGWLVHLEGVPATWKVSRSHRADLRSRLGV